MVFVLVNVQSSEFSVQSSEFCVQSSVFCVQKKSRPIGRDFFDYYQSSSFLLSS